MGWGAGRAPRTPISQISFHSKGGSGGIDSAFKSHILTKKSKKRKLALTHDGLVHESDENNVKLMLRLK